MTLIETAMPENENDPVRSSLGGLSDKASEKSEGNCPACNDNPMGTPLPHNPNVLVAPYTPPTAQELELTRNYYAAMEARTRARTGAAGASDRLTPDEVAMPLGIRASLRSAWFLCRFGHATYLEASQGQ